MSIKTKKPKDDFIEAFSIPEGSVLLDSINNASKEEMILMALKKLIKERELESDLNLNIKNYFSEGLLYLNNFAIQIVITGITSDQISIPIKSWLDNMGALGKNREVEESIIGMILTYPYLIKDVMTVIPPDVFYIDIHREIFRTVLLLYSEGKDISLEDISQSLKDNKLFNLSGGERILIELVEKVSPDFSLKENVEFLKNSYIRVGGYGESPQIVLGVKVDDENNIVYFQGLITSNDFESFLENNFDDYFTLQMDINEFEGGIDRLINYVQILDNNSLPKGIPYSQFLESRSKSIEKNRNKVNKKNQKKSEINSSDSTGYYLSSIGRVPLLNAAEELELANHVKNMNKILKSWRMNPHLDKSAKDLKEVKIGKRARDKIMAANLRLVVSVAKKYQNQGLELLDLVQEGAIGLERAVDKFDPSMGYKFSTYAYWWIRQGMIRAIDNSERTIRLPIHIRKKLSKMRRVSRELSYKFGRQPNKSEMAEAMGIDQKDLEDLISQSAPTASLDTNARREEDRSTLGELIPDPNCEEPMEGMDRTIQKEHLGTWLSQLNEREQKIMKLRFGLDGEEPLTLAEIGRQINVSRERVRQLEAKAILKLRKMTNQEMSIEKKELENLISQISSSVEDLNKTKNEIKIFGVGNAGIKVLSVILEDQSIRNLVSFQNIDTDADTLEKIQSSSKLLIGENPYRGEGTNGNPQFGSEAIKQSEKSLQEKISEEDILFVVASMGGGTGGGATPFIGRMAKDKKILTIAVVSTPTSFEGKMRMRLAEQSIKKLQQDFDLVLTVPYSPGPSEKDIKTKKVYEQDVFSYTNKLMGDTIKDLVRIFESNDNFLNTNFDDIRSLLKDSGKGIFGIGSGVGKNKALEASSAAINSSLLEDSEQLGSVKIDQAKGCLLIVKGGKDMTYEDVASASEIICDFINQKADIMVRTILDESMEDEIKVTVLLTKFSQNTPKGKNLSNKKNLKNTIMKSNEYSDDREVG